MTQISGPINLIRVEGKINNQVKIFYFFMDLHINCQAQTECSDIRSVHIRDYLINTFDNLDKTVDFFLETFPDQSTFTTRRTDIYLNQIRDMFEKIFNFNFKEGKVVKSKDFPHVRLHYMDIRPYFTFKVGDPFGMTMEISNYIYSLVNKNLYSQDIMKIRSGVDILNSQMKVIYDACFGNPKKTQAKIIREFSGQFVNYKNDGATKAINYLVDKIRNVYENKEVKKKINHIMSTELVKMFNEYQEFYIQLIECLNRNMSLVKHGYYDRVKYHDNYTYFGFVHINISDDITQEIIQVYGKYRECVIHIYILIMDLYFLRRSLDKKYVDTSVVYTGAFHSSNYIKFLLKEFDFKITHAFYSDGNLSAVNKKIMALNDSYKVMSLFLPSELSQCVDVSMFPDNFE